jgi:hypothetical protein
MAEYTAVTEQIVAVNQPIIFTETSVPCDRGFVQHEDGTGSFTLSGTVVRKSRCNCACKGMPSADYLVDFSANIAVPDGGTAETISVALSLGGTVIPATQMIVTPAATGEFFNVSVAKNVRLYAGCCRDLAVVNTSGQAISVSNAIINFTRPDLVMSY